MATVTKPIVLNETYNEKMELLISAITGMSKGTPPIIRQTLAEGAVEISANAINIFPTLTNSMNISFAPATETLDHEWIFVIPQGATAQSIQLPEIDWYLGIAPSFEANTTTEVRVHRLGDQYRGVWIV